MKVSCSKCLKTFNLNDSKSDALKKKRLKCPSCGGLLQPGLKKKVKTKKKHPDQIGGYKIEKILGIGGMGVVYKGIDQSLNRFIAIKTLSPELAKDESYRKRFFMEAQALAKLVHPHITQIYNVGEDQTQNLLYFVMEYVDGPSTEYLLKKQKKLEILRAVEIVKQVCSGLDKASQMGIIHRDIKPGNILINSDHSAKVTDFGLVKLVKEDMKLTSTGLVVGTPFYISPEQARGKIVDLRSDIYSLGATLYHYIIGKPPFTGDSAMAIFSQHVNDTVQFPTSTANAEIPLLLTGIIRKMMAKIPAQRYTSYDVLVADLDRFEKNQQEAIGSGSLNTPQTKTEQYSATSFYDPEIGMTRILAPEKKDATLGNMANNFKPVMVNFKPFFKILVPVFILLALVIFINIGKDSSIKKTRPAEVTNTALDDENNDDQYEVLHTSTNINIIKDELEKMEGGTYRFFGSAINMEKETVQNVHVQVIIFDEYDEVMTKQSLKTEPTVILPGEKARYSILVEHAADFKSYEVEIRGDIKK